MKIVALANGLRINGDTLLSYSRSGAVITFTRQDSSTTTYTATSTAEAVKMVTALDFFSLHGLGFIDFTGGPS